MISRIRSVLLYYHSWLSFKFFLAVQNQDQCDKYQYCDVLRFFQKINYFSGCIVTGGWREPGVRVKRAHRLN